MSCIIILSYFNYIYLFGTKNIYTNFQDFILIITNYQNIKPSIKLIILFYI